jgi:hypothetical protein
MENSIIVPGKIKHKITIFQQFHFWVYTQKNKIGDSNVYVLVHPHYSSILHNNQKIEATRISTGR